MREYKLVRLTEPNNISSEKELEQAGQSINQYVFNGWTIQQVAVPADSSGTMIGVFYRETRP